MNSSQLPVVLIVVCLVIMVCMISGLVKGFIRKISGLVSFIVACILVNALLPTVTSYLRTTPVYSFIREQCENVGTSIVESAVVGTITSGESGVGDDISSAVSSVTSDDGSGQLDRDKIKQKLQELGYDPSIIDSMSDEELQSYAQQLIGAGVGALSQAFETAFSINSDMAGSGKNNPVLTVRPVSFRNLYDENQKKPGAQYNIRIDLSAAGALLTDSSADSSLSDYSQSESGESLLSQLTSGMDRSEQTEFIESLPLPESLKTQMETFNNAAGYLKLGAEDFGSYVISYIANLILNVIAFVVTLLITWLIIRLILGALKVFTRLPVFGAADRILGLCVGLVQGILIVWGLFTVLSIFSSTQLGESLMAQIYSTPFLETLYNTNIFISSAAGGIKAVM